MTPTRRSPEQPRRSALAGVTLLLAVSAAPGAAQQAPAPSQAWQLSIPEGIADFALSPTEDCLAVATPQRIIALDTAGSIRWEVPLAKLSRFAQVGRVAAASHCEWIVAGGTPSYRYVWVLSPTSAQSVSTSGTPSGVAVNHAGTLAAVGTAAGTLYFIDRQGRVQRSQQFPDGVLDSLRFSPDDSLLALTGGMPVGVVAVAGGVRWTTLGGSLIANAGWDRFVTWWEPPHFSTRGSLVMLDQRGTERWHLVIHYPSAAIAPDGSYLVAAGVVEDTLAPLEESPEPATNHVIVLNTDGGRLFDGPSPYSTALKVSPDGKLFLVRERVPGEHDQLVARTREGHPAWSLAIPGYSPILVTEALRVFLVAPGGTLTAYR
jgi:hypothetical protein